MDNETNKQAQWQSALEQAAKIVAAHRAEAPEGFDPVNLVQFTSSAGLSGQFQKYFSPKLLDHAIDTLVLNQFALTAPLPREKGATQIRFTRQDVAASSNVVTLTEGVPISTFRDTTLAFVDATLQLFGEAGRYSDLLTYTELFNILDIQHQQFGEDFALKADDLTLNAVIPNVTGSSKRYSGGATTWAALAALATNAAGAMTVTDALDAFTQLSDQKAPKIGGEYVMVVPPRVARDLMNDTKWITAGQYGTTKGLFNGEIGRLYDVRFMVSTNAWWEDGTAGAENTRTTTHGAKDIYASIATGRSSYGVPALSGMSTKSPSIVIVNTPDSLNPLNQYTTCGWKAYYTAILLNNAFVCVLRSRSGFA
jgi:N4-gp56 family major capsid protein